MSTDPGDIVLDPFLGTGTTAIAAKALGRHYIGIDIDPMYKKIAEEKLAKIEPSLFNGYYVSYYLGKIQSIRDLDAAKIFPPQLTSTEKKLLRRNGNGENKPKEAEIEMVIQPSLLEKPESYQVESSEK